jgi:hypothetical protein
MESQEIKPCLSLYRVKRVRDPGFARMQVQSHGSQPLFQCPLGREDPFLVGAEHDKIVCVAYQGWPHPVSSG